MENWKEAFWLAKFELKASKLSFLFLLLVFPFAALGFVANFNSYLDDNFVGIDLFLFFSSHLLLYGQSQNIFKSNK